MNRFSIPILAWVVIGLIVVGALPFVVTWVQIDHSRDALVVETQQTQRLVARTIADETSRYYEVIETLIAVTADDPGLYLAPDSEPARQSLARLLSMNPSILAVGLFAAQEKTDPIPVFQLRRSGERGLPEEYLAPTPTAPRALVGKAQYVRIQRETTRPGVFLSVLAVPPQLDAIIRIAGVSESTIAILDAHGDLLAGDGSILEMIPAASRTQLMDARVPVGSNSEFGSGAPLVWAFASVPDTDWRVLTMQRADAAEQATADMRAAARFAFGIVLAVVVSISFGAWRFVVRPIRRLIKAQSRLAGMGQGASGGEIAQLEASFRSLENAMQDRDALSEVFLDRFQILKPLGSGAMGMVYLGWDPKLKRKVALKTIRLSSELSAEQRQKLAVRLLQEGQTAAQLTHPNIVTIYDVVGDENHAFIAMEFVDGSSLEEVLHRQGPLPPRLVADVAEGVLRALKAAHGVQVIHRDIKPANIMQSGDGVLKLSDFGIASFGTQLAKGDEGMILGTPGYLAPETYNENAYDERTDLFALGVTLVELLTANRPFVGRDIRQIMMRTVQHEVILPEQVANRMPTMMVKFIDSLLEKRVKARFQNAEEALQALAAFRSDISDTSELDMNEVSTATENESGEPEATTELDLGTLAGTQRIDQP